MSINSGSVFSPNSDPDTDTRTNSNDINNAELNPNPVTVTRSTSNKTKTRTRTKSDSLELAKEQAPSLDLDLGLDFDLGLDGLDLDLDLGLSPIDFDTSVPASKTINSDFSKEKETDVVNANVSVSVSNIAVHNPENKLHLRRGRQGLKKMKGQPWSDFDFDINFKRPGPIKHPTSSFQTINGRAGNRKSLHISAVGINGTASTSRKVTNSNYGTNFQDSGEIIRDKSSKSPTKKRRRKNGMPKLEPQLADIIPRHPSTEGISIVRCTQCDRIFQTIYFYSVHIVENSKGDLLCSSTKKRIIRKAKNKDKDKDKDKDKSFSSENSLDSSSTLNSTMKSNSDSQTPVESSSFSSLSPSPSPASLAVDRIQKRKSNAIAVLEDSSASLSLKKFKSLQLTPNSVAHSKSLNNSIGPTKVDSIFTFDQEPVLISDQQALLLLKAFIQHYENNNDNERKGSMVSEKVIVNYDSISDQQINDHHHDDGKVNVGIAEPVQNCDVLQASCRSKSPEEEVAYRKIQELNKKESETLMKSLLDNVRAAFGGQNDSNHNQGQGQYQQKLMDNNNSKSPPALPPIKLKIQLKKCKNQNEGGSGKNEASIFKVRNGIVDSMHQQSPGQVQEKDKVTIEKPKFKGDAKTKNMQKSKKVKGRNGICIGNVETNDDLNPAHLQEKKVHRQNLPCPLSPTIGQEIEDQEILRNVNDLDNDLAGDRGPQKGPNFVVFSKTNHVYVDINSVKMEPDQDQGQESPSRPPVLKMQCANSLVEAIDPQKFLPLKDRVFDPDKHCGVLCADEDPGQNQGQSLTEDQDRSVAAKTQPRTFSPCKRSLTCKSHSVILKRTVQGRKQSFDELLSQLRKANACYSSSNNSSQHSSPKISSPAQSQEKKGEKTSLVTVRTPKKQDSKGKQKPVLALGVGRKPSASDNYQIHSGVPGQVHAQGQGQDVEINWSGSTSSNSFSPEISPGTSPWSSHPHPNQNQNHRQRFSNWNEKQKQQPQTLFITRTSPSSPSLRAPNFKFKPRFDFEPTLPSPGSDCVGNNSARAPELICISKSQPEPEPVADLVKIPVPESIPVSSPIRTPVSISLTSNSSPKVMFGHYSSSSAASASHVLLSSSMLTLLPSSTTSGVTVTVPNPVASKISNSIIEVSPGSTSTPTSSTVSNHHGNAAEFNSSCLKKP